LRGLVGALRGDGPGGLGKRVVAIAQATLRGRRTAGGQAILPIGWVPVGCGLGVAAVFS
jgi:hypothetical protein